MKISIRLLLLTFSIVVILTVSSAIIYYSLTNSILTTQQQQSILNSANDFIFNFQSVVEDIESEYRSLTSSDKSIEQINIEDSYIDFIFTLVDDKNINFENFVSTNNLNIRSRNLTLSQFLSDNPNVILKYDITESNTFYYGKVITKELLENISEKIRADVALIVNETPYETTSSEQGQSYLPAILDGIKDLRFKNQFDIYSDTYGAYDFYSTYYEPTNLITKDYKIGFMIFNTPYDVVDYRYNTGIITIIMIVVGIALAMILVLLFSAKLRNQLSNLSYAAKVTQKGNLDYRVKVEANDEIGRLGTAFNNMLDVLKSQKEAEKEYTEFITLLNQNPNLNDIADAALQKIVKATGISFGVLYLVEEKNKLNNIASYGIGKGINETDKNFDYYKNAIEQKDIIEFTYKKNLPVVRTGITEIRIKYIVILPIIYGSEVVAIAELASEEMPDKDIKKYLLKIREQLAIGIINGTSFERLQKLVDELKQLNIEYEDQNKALKKVQSELELKAEQLNTERLKALESTQLKSQFITNITHELKTPLNSIIGLTGLINKDNTLPASHQKRIDVIIRNSKKLLNLINNILEFSKAEAGKTKIKKDTFELSSLLNEINSLIQPNASEKGLNYICESPNDYSVTLHTDKNKLEQILINLLNNSVKFTEEGLIKLSVAIEEHHSLRFDVIDTGIGIEEKDQKNIFEEFRQADGTLSRQYDGTGLGLSICKRFTELLEGEFKLESKAGSGSTFTVIIPNIIIQKDKKDLDQQKSTKQKIAILDESQTNKKLFGDYLALNGYQLIEPESPDKINNTLVEKNVSLAIINQAIYGKLGWNILVDLKSRQQTKDIVPIIVSVNAEKNYGYGLAVFDYIKTENFEKGCENVFKQIRSYHPSESLKLVSISDQKIVNDYLESNYQAAVYTKLGLNNLLYGESASELPDILFIDMKSASDIELIDKLKHDRRTRKIVLIAILPEQISDAQLNEFYSKLNELTLQRKHHTLDVLKIFRDRLKIAENELARTKLILEDDTEELSAAPTKERVSEQPKVLIVDDDRDTLYTVGEIVKAAGYKPIFAQNGVECILTLKKEIPDLILLDIMMPKMDGFETLREIKKNIEYKNIPVIALTAYAMLDDKDIIDRSGFTEVITKPIDTSVITIKMEEILQTKLLSK